MHTRSKPQPIEIKRLESKGLQIDWSDGTTHQISSKTLRENCPAADSRAERGDSSHEKPLTAKSSSLSIVTATREEAIHLEKIWSVGNYALGLRWLDGHDTGIYTFDYLYTLGEQEKVAS